MKSYMLIFVIIFFFSSSLLLADIIHVPADTSTIQGGIYLASDGDTLLVAENTYYENINFRGKAITLASRFIMDRDTSHISKTIIDGSQPSDPDSGSVITFNSGEDTTAMISGFTINNGTGLVDGMENWGGGIYCHTASPKIENCVIVNNSAYYGGGIYCYDSAHNISFSNVTLRGNSANRGGGIYCNGGGFDGSITNLSLTNVTIENNTASIGGGIRFDMNSILNLSNVKINNNSATHGGGIFCSESNCNLSNVTISNNSADYGGGIYFGWKAQLNFDNENTCNVYSNKGSIRGKGNDFYNDLSDTIAVVVDTFTVMNPTDYYAAPMGKFTFDILNAKEITAMDESNHQIPQKYSLSQNYPNPFNPSTTIEFTLPKSEFVELKVYNILGKEVSTLVSNKLNQGKHTYTFDGKNLASGVYYYQLVAGEYREVKKMILLR